MAFDWQTYVSDGLESGDWGMPDFEPPTLESNNEHSLDQNTMLFIGGIVLLIIFRKSIT